jgi:hypothetical protein
MSDVNPTPMHDLTVEEIAELLEELGTDLAAEELHAAASFVHSMGDVNAALAAIEALEDRKAA